LIGGESGIGKSTLLADKVTDWSEEGNPVMFYKASSLNSPEIGQKFIRDMAIKVPYPEEFFALVDDTMTASGKYFYLVLDAVNEYNGDVNMLINAIESLVAQGADYKWFRVVITVRDSSYKRAHARFGSRVQERYLSVEIDQAGEKVRTMIIPLGRLTENTVGLIYEKYRSYLVKDIEDENDPGYHIFKPNTAFAELDSNGSTVEQMKSPLMMRLILQAFNRKDLPSNLSTDNAMQIYLDEVITEVHNPNGSFPARKNFLTSLVRTLDRAGFDTIRKDDVLTNASLREAIMNPQKDSPYVQLLDLGVLVEEWEEGECYVRFSFDRLFEFLLADEHFKRDITIDYLRDLIDRSKVFKSMEGALQVIMTRLVLNGRRAVIMELIDGINPEEERSIQLIVGFLKTLFYLDKEEFTQLTENLPEDPTTSDLHILSELLKNDLVFSTTETERLLEIMLEIAQFLNDLKYQADVLCLTGNHLMSLRESKLAYTHFEEARKKFDTIGDLDGLARTYNLIGRSQIEIDLCAELQDYEVVEKDHHQSNFLTEESLNELVPQDQSWLVSLNKAYEINSSLDTKDARVRMVQNLINKAFGYSEAMEWTPLMFLAYRDENEEKDIRNCKEKYIKANYLEALKHAIEIDYKEGQSNICNNLASLEMGDNFYEKALEYLEKGIPLAESTGDSKMLGFMYWNLAVCKINLQQIEVSDYIKLRLKAAEFLKRSGSLISEIEHMESFLKPLRYYVRGNELNGDDKSLINNTITDLLFNLTERWFNSLTTSKHKSGMSDGDMHVVGRLMEWLVDISWIELNSIRENILKSSSISQLIGIYALFESDRIKERLEFSAIDLKLIDTFAGMSVETLHQFEKEESKTSEAEFDEMKSEFKKRKVFIEAIIDDNWQELFKLTKFDISSEDENYDQKLSQRLLSNLGWCKDIQKSKELFDPNKKDISDYLKKLKKDKDKSIHYRFAPEAILILEKLTDGKKISEKEMMECVSHFDLSYADEFPFVFFYRLIVYLNEHNETELLKEVLQKLDEQDLRFPEVWPRSEEMKKIRERIESQTGV